MQRKDLYKPFIKRVGGKRQLLSQLNQYFPKKFGAYFEPFVWWGAVFFHLRNLYWTSFKATLSDINSHMVITYNTIKNDVQGLIKELKTYPYDKDFYMDIRAWDKDLSFDKRSDIQKSARFIYLNRTGFNGLYRENSQWFNNVPFWSYTNPKICDEETLLNDQKALKNTEIFNQDFEETLKNAKKWDFIYLDPPYDPLTITANFTGYNKWGFGKDEQMRLFEMYQELDKKWCFVMLSNHNTDFINDLYKKYNKHTVLATRMINSNAEKKMTSWRNRYF